MAEKGEFEFLNLKITNLIADEEFLIKDSKPSFFIYITTNTETEVAVQLNKGRWMRHV
jgi:hypothetical protein